MCELTVAMILEGFFLDTFRGLYLKLYQRLSHEITRAAYLVKSAPEQTDLCACIHRTEPTK